MCLEIAPSSSSRTVIFQHQAQSGIPKNNLSFQKTHHPNSVAWSQLAVEVLLRPVYWGSWICMEKFNSENSSRTTYRGELNAPIHIQTQRIVRETTTTDAWQPSGRQSGRKEHEFLPLGVQASRSRSIGSSESRMRGRSARGRRLWWGRSWEQSAFPWQDDGQIFGGRHPVTYLVIPQVLRPTYHGDIFGNNLSTVAGIVLPIL